MKHEVTQSNDAVSTVVSAMLILVIITTFITAINAYYIPSLATQHEIKHMHEVQESFTELAAKTISGSPEAKVYIPLGDGGLPLMGSLSSSGSISVFPDEGNISISLSNVHDVEKEFKSFTTINDITWISKLTMKMENAKSGTYTVSLNNDSNNRTSILIRSDDKVVVQTIKNGDEIFYDIVLGDWVMGDFLSIDLLNPDYGFSNMIDSATKPISLTFEGPFYIKYDSTAELINVNSGYFKYKASNNFWIDQEYIFENGAVILKQGRDSAIRSRPFVTEDESHLNLFLFNIIGEKKSVSGNGASTVNINVKNRDERRYLEVMNTTVTITSKTPEAWYNYFSGIADDEPIIENNTITAWFNNRDVTIIILDVEIIIP